MSRRMLLAASSGVVEPPGPVDPTDPEPTPDGWPTTSDPNILAARPSGRRLASFRVGGSEATHESIGDASSDAQEQAQLDGKAGGAITWLGNPGPDYRVDVFVEPGTYLEHLGWGGWVNLVGTAPGVTVREEGSSQGTIHTFGTMHLENVTVESAVDGDNLSPKYALHITGAEQVVFVDSMFDVVDAQGSSNWSGGGVMGADFLAGSYFLAYGCTYRGAAGQEGNMHGPASGSFDEGVTTVYVDCTWEGGLSGPQFGGNAPSTGTHHMYVIGGNPNQINAGPGVHVHTDLSVPVVGGGTVTRGVTTWPQPTDGLAERWSDYYLPSNLGVSTVYSNTVGDAAPMTPVTGRTYITRIDPGVGVRATHIRHTAAASGGTYGAHLAPADGDTPPAAQPGLDYTNTGTGVRELQHYYYTTRYPGDRGWWVYHRFGAGSSVTGSSSLPGVTDCFYTDDGTTLVPVASGTAHPLTALRAT